MERDNNGKPSHGKKWIPAMYVAYFGLMQEIGNRHGYAVAVHGSVQRDFDVFFVPFDDVVSSHEVVLNELWEMVVGKDFSLSYEDVHNANPAVNSMIDKHGRSCYMIMCGASGYFDISFTPTLEQAAAHLKKEEAKKAEVDEFLERVKVGW